MRRAACRVGVVHSLGQLLTPLPHIRIISIAACSTRRRNAAIPRVARVGGAERLAVSAQASLLRPSCASSRRQ
jgi:hypothetical protein